MKKTIYYISGEGHSGSTLFDIILGAQKNAFSCGELMFLPQKGMKNNEYCSCHKKVHECDVWKKIIKDWNIKRKLPLDKYIEIQQRLLSLKKAIRASNLINSQSNDIKEFLNDTKHLYSIIFETTNSDIVIDSSKNPNRILILKKLGFDVIVIHLVRSFGSVLNSYKKTWTKDLQAGIEENILPQKTTPVLASWLVKNFLTRFFSKDLPYHKVRYEYLIENPTSSIKKISIRWDKEYASKLKNRGPFIPNHLVAGNRMRMKSELYIADKPLDTNYQHLKYPDKLLSQSIDFFY